MKLPHPAQIDKGKTYVLGGEALIELMKRPKIIGTQNEILVREEEDGTRILSLAHNAPTPPPRLSPWNCYITPAPADPLTVKVNPISRLLKTFSYKGDWKETEWSDAFDVDTISSFTSPLVLTAYTHKVWMEIAVLSGSISSVQIKNGVPADNGWENYPHLASDYTTRTASAELRASGSGDFRWYQLLAYFKEVDTGEQRDVKFGSLFYRLMCPTTTHLMQGFVFGIHDGDNTTPEAHYAIVPWTGCITPP